MVSRLGAVFLLALLTSCGKAPARQAEPKGLAPQTPSSRLPTVPSALRGTNQPTMFAYEIVHTWPHDKHAFTQGLIFFEGQLFESTGLNGASTLRRVELETGKVIQQVALPYDVFAEGLALIDDKLFQLTWQNGKCLVYDRQSFQRQKEFTYAGEGWGLTSNGKLLVMSDGTDQIRFRDPTTFEVKKNIRVTVAGQPLAYLNELEWVKGEILANIWRTDLVARIEPSSGVVTGLVNFRGLLAAEDYDLNTDVLNGIAYDAAGDRLFVTGKHWPKLFEVRLKQQPGKSVGK